MPSGARTPIRTAARFFVAAEPERVDGDRHRRRQGRIESWTAPLEHAERHGEQNMGAGLNRTVRAGHADSTVRDLHHDDLGVDSALTTVW
jgi:hypothetical protein